MKSRLRLSRRPFSFSKIQFSSRSVCLELLEGRTLLSGVVAPLATSLPSASPTFRLFHRGNAMPDGSTTAPSGAVTPAEMRGAYGINSIVLPNVVTADGSGQTIAVVDAYDDPNALSDLQTFDSQYGLPNPVSFQKLDQNGGTSRPASNSGWGLETALDLEWAHAIAPQANLILYEANSSSLSDLFTAVGTARNNAAVAQVSMSFGTSGDFGGETVYDSTFTSGGHGVTFFGATGDSGGVAGYPATSPNVVAVGGTTLTTDSNGDHLNESAWSGSSGSLSTQESRPAYQNGFVAQNQRGTPDVAMDADPNTGVPVYDSTYQSGGSWYQVGGTSLATPMWAALQSIVNQGRVANNLPTYDGATGALPRLYALPISDFNDITSGANKSFAATSGYDLVTGRGSPIASKLIPDLANIPANTTPQPPTIGSLSATPNPAAPSQNITLTANNVSAAGDPGAVVQSVSFYRESNGVSGLQTTSPSDTLLGTVNSGGSGWSVTQPSGLPTGTYTFYAVATDSKGLTSTVASTSVSVNTPAVLGSQADIGSVGRAGSGSLSNGVYTVQGSGSDIWGTADAFHYVYTSISGNETIIARVDSVGNTNGWAKAGVMIRASTASNAQQAMIAVTPGNGVAFQWRTNTGGGSSNSNVTGIAAPEWVKLVRSGNSFTGYASSNGSSWTQIGPAVTIAMSSSALAGLAVTAHNNSALCTATFDNVSLTAGTAGVVASNANSVPSNSLLASLFDPSDAGRLLDPLDALTWNTDH